MRKISEKEQEYLNTECEIEFYNLEEPAKMLIFSSNISGKMKKYVLFHGQRYRLSQREIEHIESKGEKIWDYVPDGMGSMVKKLVSNKPRFQCRRVFSSVAA